jgi:hypothetical protein
VSKVAGNPPAAPRETGQQKGNRMKIAQLESMVRTLEKTLELQEKHNSQPHHIALTKRNLAAFKKWLGEKQAAQPSTLKA